MSDSTEQCVQGSPEAVAAWMRSLGLATREDGEVTAPRDPRVLSWTPPKEEPLMGQDAWIVRLVVTEPLPLPEGIHPASEALARATTGVMMGSHVPAEIERRQFFIGLNEDGLISDQELEESDRYGTIPPIIEAVFSTLPANEARRARSTFRNMNYVRRDSPLLQGVSAAIAASGGPSVDWDDAFRRWKEL